MIGYTTENTAKSNKWAISNYSQWYTERNTEATNSPLEILYKIYIYIILYIYTHIQGKEMNMIDKVNPQHLTHYRKFI